MAGFWPDLRFAVRQLAESLVGLHVEGHAARLASEACLVPRLQITKKNEINEKRQTKHGTFECSASDGRIRRSGAGVKLALVLRF